MSNEHSHLPPDRLWQPTTAKWFAAIFGTSLVLGLNGWLAPKGWHGGLPPISLVALLVALAPLLVRRKMEHDKRLRHKEREDDNAESEEAE